jgi:hypothetical protein
MTSARVLWAPTLLILLLRPGVLLAQTPPGEQEDKRIFGIIPNYRTSPTLRDYKPITASEKFKIAVDDSFDRGTFILAALFGGEAQITNSTPAFGHGFSAYGKYYAASWSDFVIGDFMTEGIYPALFHQDPRYFRHDTGSGWSRLRYAMGQIFITHADGGGMQVNVSELLGNATAVGLANAYYPGAHSWSANAGKLAIQLGVDMAANIVKEFAPDIDRAFSRKREKGPGEQ